MRKSISGIALALLLLLPPPIPAEELPEIGIHTDYWPPYVRQEGERAGSASEFIRLVAREMGYRIDWQYFPYAFGYRQVLRGEIPLSFPYFKTRDRLKEVLFSEPLFTVTSRVYFNRQFHKFDHAPADLSAYRMGRVAGYSYGEKLDAILADAIVYGSDTAALNALFQGKIELLPMTKTVAREILKEHFPNRLHLIRAVPGIIDHSNLYLIAEKSARGEDLLASFNRAFEQLQASGILEGLLGSQNGLAGERDDLAELEVAEGFPVILGQTGKVAGQSEYFSIPQGTRVLVLDWSEKIRAPAENDRLYKTMVDVSRVLILNGPHVGKELYVKNMHIRIL